MRSLKMWSLIKTIARKVLQLPVWTLQERSHSAKTVIR